MCSGTPISGNLAAANSSQRTTSENTGHTFFRSRTIFMYSTRFTEAHVALLRSCTVRVKMTLSVSTRASGAGGSSKDGTSAVGCAKNGVPCECLLLHSGVAVSAQADLLRTKSAQGCQHLGRLRCFADMLALAPNPIIIGACVDWHLGLFRSNVNEAIPTCEDTTVLVTNADARWTGVCRLLRPCCA